MFCDRGMFSVYSVWGPGVVFVVSFGLPCLCFHCSGTFCGTVFLLFIHLFYLSILSTHLLTPAILSAHLRNSLNFHPYNNLAASVGPKHPYRKHSTPLLAFNMYINISIHVSTIRRTLKLSWFMYKHILKTTMFLY